MKTREQVLDDIQKLLAFASNRAASEHEVENYTRLARKLMQRYNIEEHEALRDGTATTASQAAYESIQDEGTFLRRSRTVEKYDQYIAIAASEVCDCKVYLKSVVEGTRTYKRVHFFGLPSDVAVCIQFHKDIDSYIKLLAKVRFGSVWGVEHKDYTVGFAAKLIDVVREMKRSETDCVAIVLCKNALLTRYEAERLNIKYSESYRGKNYSDSEAFRAGACDAESFDAGNRKGSLKEGEA